MKHFTKEYYKLELLSYANYHLKQSQEAETKDEEFYQTLYQNQYALFFHNERMCDLYQDPIEKLQQLNDWIGEPNITDEERDSRTRFKELYETVYEEKIHDRTACTFDEEICKQQFAERHKAQIEIFQRLPQEILNKIADIRVFALGYASAEVKRLLRPYCTILQKTVKEIKEKAHAETIVAEGYLTNRIGFNEIDEFILMSLEEKGDDIYLTGKDNYSLLIKNGQIIEGKDKTIFQFDENIPNCPWSIIIAAELHRIYNKFEVNFLVENTNEIENKQLWYLTIQGTDIQKIPPR